MRSRRLGDWSPILLSLNLAVLSIVAVATNAAGTSPAPLFDNLGDLHHPVSTSSPMAQRYFDQGLTLCYGFNHREAIRSFRAAAELDPNCAMAHWGIAYALGPHVNKPMSKEENDQAWNALQQGLALREQATPWEQAYLDALSKRYTVVPPDDRAPLDRAWADAMRQVRQAYPDDLNAAAIFAEALMDTMPWNYWSKDRTPKPETEEALAALRSVMQRNPDHPGANHLFIHAIEAGPMPEIALPAADRLGSFAPGAGHLVHMPSHIYMRVGQYHDATVANERAVKADFSYIQSCRAQGFYPGAYYPHNLHFLWWALAFEGRSREALREAETAAAYARDNSCGPRKALEAPRLRHLPWLTLARFGRWEELLRIDEPPRTNDFLVDRALWHFTRGLALAACGEADAAARQQVELAALANSEEAKKLNEPTFPVTDTLAVATHWLAGKVAGAQGDKEAMVAHLTKAVAAEEALPYMEPSYWPFPARPALGAALVQAGEPAKAEEVFREDLSRWRRNPWSLFGLESALRQQGKIANADLVRREFDKAWRRADLALNLAWF